MKTFILSIFFLVLSACAPGSKNVSEDAFPAAAIGIYELVSYSEGGSLGGGQVFYPMTGSRLTITASYWTVETCKPSCVLEAEGHGPKDFTSDGTQYHFDPTQRIIFMLKTINARAYVYQYKRQ